MQNKNNYESTLHEHSIKGKGANSNTEALKLFKVIEK